MKLGGVIVVGVVLGLVGGLIYTWFVAPVQYYDTYPPMLAARYRRDWVKMAVEDYGRGESWDRTEKRLVDVPHEEIRVVAVETLEHAVAQGEPAEMLTRVARLAAAYGATGPGVTLYAGAQVVAPAAPAPTSRPSPTPPAATPTSSPVPTPTLTPTPTVLPPPPFRIISQTLTCDPLPSIAVSLQLSRTVEVRGRERQEMIGLPMRELWLIWDDGADRAITGFRPELGLGYVDFEVEPGRTYNLYVDNPYGRPILTVQVEPCAPEDGVGWTSRSLVLLDETQPEATATVTPTLTAGPAIDITVTAVSATGTPDALGTRTATVTVTSSP